MGKQLKSYNDVPGGFVLCMNNDCSRCSTCLRNLVWRLVPDTIRQLTIINPQQATGDDSCQHYRDNTPIPYARGFKNIFDHLLPPQHEHFVTEMQSHFSRNPYYERRRGARLMPPSEQTIFYNALKHAGVTEELDFDRFEDHLNWFD